MEPLRRNQGAKESGIYRVRIRNPGPKIYLVVKYATNELTYQVDFCSRFDIERCKSCACDSLTFFFNESYRWRESKECGRQTSLYLDFLHSMFGDPNKRGSSELYLQFSSDDSVNLKGFNISFIASITSSK